MDDEKQKAVAKALGEPVFTEFPENTWKIRTNLIIASLISIAVVFADLHIEPDSRVFGLKFRGLTDAVLTNTLTAVVGYLLAHFLWAAFDSFLEWRLRITGTRLAFKTGSTFGSQHADYPDDPRQSTLYNWWMSRTGLIGKESDHFAQIGSRLDEVERELRAALAASSDPGTSSFLTNTMHALGRTQESFRDVRTGVEQARAAVQDARIPESLHRFDTWFQLFLRSQNLRWLLIDFGFPVLAALYALGLLIHRL